jgi:hypothetical protein
MYLGRQGVYSVYSSLQEHGTRVFSRRLRGMSFRSGVMQSLAMNFVRGSKFGKSAVRASDSLFGKIHRKLPPRLCGSRLCRAKASLTVRKKATRIFTRDMVARQWAGTPEKVLVVISSILPWAFLSPDRLDGRRVRGGACENSAIHRSRPYRI